MEGYNHEVLNSWSTALVWDVLDTTNKVKVWEGNEKFYNASFHLFLMTWRKVTAFISSIHQRKSWLNPLKKKKLVDTNTADSVIIRCIYLLLCYNNKIWLLSYSGWAEYALKRTEPEYLYELVQIYLIECFGLNFHCISLDVNQCTS